LYLLVVLCMSVVARDADTETYAVDDLKARYFLPLEGCTFLLACEEMDLYGSRVVC
jgi:hypothetical protein